MEEFKKDLNADSFTDQTNRRSPKHLGEEFLYSLVIALVPTFIFICLFIYYHQDTPLSVAGYWLLGSFISFTVLVFLFRQVASKKLLKVLALVFLGGLFAFTVLLTINSGIVCVYAGGSVGYYHPSEGIVHDIHGNIMTQIGHGFALDTVCYVPQADVPDILNHHSVFYDSTTFIAQ